MASTERDSKRQSRSNGPAVASEGNASPHDDANRGKSAAAATATAARRGPPRTRPTTDRDHPGSRHRWQDLPEFCDATAAVSAATYGARRLPEIRAMYRRRQSQATDDPMRLLDDDPSSASRPPSGRTGGALRSGGCKTSNRHLRRRATSHLSRKRHRFPSSRWDDEGGESSKTEVAPTKVNNEAIASADASHPPSRRKRRKKRETLCQGRESWKEAPETTNRVSFEEVGDNTHRGDSDPGNHKTHWIPTHRWHAKRFRVETMFGWKVPVVHSNRGAKAALRLAREGKTLVQDATYECCQPVVVRVSIPELAGADGTARELQRVLPNVRFNLQEKRRLVDGMLHHRDSFPLRPIGPVQWVVASCEFLFQDSTRERDPSDQSSVILYLFVHVSIRTEALECLHQWASQLPTAMSASVVAHGVPGGMASLRLRGADAMETLESASAVLGFDPRPHSSAAVAETNHGTVLSFPSQLATGGVVYGVIQCPRDPDATCNRGSVGVDVWCHPSWASKLLVALVVRGGACPIGLVEQTHLAMEAEPPLPVFPRDYVDTSAGVSYWTPGGNLAWRVYRSCLEAGLGRIDVSDNGPSTFVSWSSVASSSDNAAAVVRGAFGLPFEQCFPSLASEPSRDSSGRRARRPQRPSNAIVHVPPLPRERLAVHQAMCQALLDSLALPTLILCHVLVSGKGGVVAGDTIFDFSSSLPRGQPLGRVTCGAFSPFRGAYHGLAVCGASRLLETIKAARSFVRTDHFPHRCHCLAVQVGNISPKFVGSLSLLF